MMNKPYVLVADEDKDIRFLIQVYLREYDVEFLEASDGEQCLNLARGNRPALIVLNYMLDKLSGYQVAEEISKDEHIKDIPVILMTIEGFDLTKERSGIKEYLVKPFDKKQFSNTVSKVLGPRMFSKIQVQKSARSIEENKTKPQSAGSDTSAVKKKILIADDDMYVIKLLKILLEKKYDLDEVASGDALVEKAAANKYDLIISDVIMPKMSGWKSIKKIREKGCDVPVIFNSGLVKDQELYETLKPTGTSCFILKPFKNEELLAAVERLLL